MCYQNKRDKYLYYISLKRIKEIAFFSGLKMWLDDSDYFVY